MQHMYRWCIDLKIIFYTLKTVYANSVCTYADLDYQIDTHMYIQALTVIVVAIGAAILVTLATLLAGIG